MIVRDPLARFETPEGKDPGWWRAGGDFESSRGLRACKDDREREKGRERINKFSHKIYTSIMTLMTHFAAQNDTNDNKVYT